MLKLRGLKKETFLTCDIKYINEKKKSLSHNNPDRCDSSRWPSFRLFPNLVTVASCAYHLALAALFTFGYLTAPVEGHPHKYCLTPVPVLRAHRQ